MTRFLRAAIAHISPVTLSSQGTTQKVVQHIHKASSNSANLLCFPESFIPAFPIWSSFLAPTQNHGFFQQMAKESVYADGEEVAAIRHAAAKAKMIVSLGISEKVRYSTATLFNSNLIIGTDGTVLVHHRKLMPTWFEKLTWAQGDGYGLRVADTIHGKIGALVCGENTNPLARYALMAQGEEVHISSWPAVWPSRTDRLEGYGEADSPSTVRNYDNVAANRMRAAAHCFEAKCFGIMSAPFMSEENVESIASMSTDPDLTTKILTAAPRAPSMFLDPTGTVLPGFSIDPVSGTKQVHDFLQHKEEILYADMDLDQCVEGKQYHDVVGGYQRFDVFDLKVNMARRGPVTFRHASSDEL